MGTEPRRGGSRAWWLVAVAWAIAMPAAASGQGAGWTWLAWDAAESYFEMEPAPAFLDRQLEYGRVRAAMREKRGALADAFAERGIPYPPVGLYLRVFKRERVVEAWVRPLGSTQHTLFRTYPMCVLSGTLGPKRKRGDFQVPEGFYQITDFNPTSEYHLSLGINYPNASDVILGDDDGVGGDIFIHGGCKTIGCMPLTDDQIKEVYWLAVEARTAGQRQIPVHIFPTRLDEAGMVWLEQEFAEEPTTRAFWANLRGGYLAFEETRQVPFIAVDRSGRYLYGAAARAALLARPVPGGPTLIGQAADAERAGAVPLLAPPRQALLGEDAAASRRPVAEGLIETEPDEGPGLVGQPVAGPDMPAAPLPGPVPTPVPTPGGPALVGSPFVLPVDSPVQPADSTGAARPRRESQGQDLPVPPAS